MILIALAVSAALQSSDVPAAHCRFTGDRAAWTGTCGHVFDEEPVFTLAPEAKITTGIWREGATPQIALAGKLSNKGDPDYPVELEIYDHGTGVIRTEYGWHRVSHFKISDSTIAFDMDAQHELPPNDLDLRILEHAAALLKNTDSWNRADDRRCTLGAQRLSLYCAIVQASFDITGGFHHRRPAAELVRTIVEDRSKGRSYHHRLMDYNNDPTTTLQDIQAILTQAETQTRSALASTA